MRKIRKKCRKCGEMQKNVENAEKCGTQFSPPLDSYMCFHHKTSQQKIPPLKKSSQVQIKHSLVFNTIGQRYHKMLKPMSQAITQTIFKKKLQSVQNLPPPLSLTRKTRHQQGGCQRQGESMTRGGNKSPGNYMGG